MEKIIKSDDEWRQILTEEQFRVTRKHGTEPAFSGALYEKHEVGIYHCVCCGAALFDSQTKFDSGLAGPAFMRQWPKPPLKKPKITAFSCDVPRCIAAPVMRILVMCS